ncbi:MAG: enoyl-CoA hydratase-related protein, partial [Thermodesulfobacteriota bacterium]
MAEKEILYAREGAVAVITLNRPERMNALTLTNHGELAQAIDEAYNDDRVRVIVLTGAGKGFCSGDDVGDVFLSPEEDQFKTRGAKLRQLEGEHPFPGGGHMLVDCGSGLR